MVKLIGIDWVNYRPPTGKTHMEFGCDTEADIASLPTTGTYTENGCEYGTPDLWSLATVAANKSIYYLASGCVWTKMGA